jgi:hypothetical protein
VTQPSTASWRSWRWWAVPRRHADFLTVVRRFTPEEAWPKVEAAFQLGRALRASQRENDEPVNDVGVFLDMIDTVVAEWRTIAENQR